MESALYSRHGWTLDAVLDFWYRNQNQGKEQLFGREEYYLFSFWGNFTIKDINTTLNSIT